MAVIPFYYTPPACPAWCTVRHGRLDEGVHASTLTELDAERLVRLWQDPGASRPVVTILTGDDYEDLTLRQARRAGGELARLARQGRGPSLVRRLIAHTARR